MSVGKGIMACVSRKLRTKFIQTRAVTPLECISEYLSVKGRDLNPEDKIEGTEN